MLSKDQGQPWVGRVVHATFPKTVVVRCVVIQPFRTINQCQRLKYTKCLARETPSTLLLAQPSSWGSQWSQSLPGRSEGVLHCLLGQRLQRGHAAHLLRVDTCMKHKANNSRKQSLLRVDK